MERSSHEKNVSVILEASKFLQISRTKISLLLHLLYNVKTHLSKEKNSRLIQQTFHGLTSCAGMTCHARREFFVPNCNIFSVSGIFKYNPGKTNDKFLTS